MIEFLMPIYSTVVGIIIGSLVSYITTHKKKYQQHRHEEDLHDKSLDAGMMILLRQQIKDYYRTYEYQDKILAEDWEEIEETHRVYKALGGNHTGDRMYEELRTKHITEFPQWGNGCEEK